MRYSLANYRLSVTIPSSLASQLGIEELSIGGEGSYTESISISYTNDLFTTTSDATGSWVHEKNLARNGTVTVSINQMSKQIARFKRLCNLFYSSTEEGDEDGLTMVLTDNTNQVVATCVDCYITRIPEQSFAATTSNQSWTFTCGKITFN